MAKGAERIVLAGDIGGTKTELALFGLQGSGLRPLRRGLFQNIDFEGPEEVISGFLGMRGMGGKGARGIRGEAIKVEAAAIGVAATVEDNTARLTNIDWTLEGERVGRMLSAKKVELINDLVATGWGLRLLLPEDLLTLNPGIEAPGNAVLIAPGTGLGECLLFWDGARHIPSASEGGHADFAPTDRLQSVILEELTEVYGHVSYERVLSGQGIKNIFDILSRKTQASSRVLKRIESEDPPAVITEEGAAFRSGRGGDETCAETLRVFVRVLGSEAGNLALKALATGGVFVGGGIAPRIKDALTGGDFMEAFISKGRFRGYLSSVPVKVVLNPSAALLGSARYAGSMLIDKELSLA